MGVSGPTGSAAAALQGALVLHDAVSPVHRAGAPQRGEHQQRVQGGVPDAAREGLRHVVRLLDGAAGTTRALDAGVRLPRF